MAKRFVVQEDEPVQSRFTKSVKLSGVIKNINPKDLKPNPRNKELFSTNNADLEKLKADIQERGILTPLMVKKDNTLLTGHTRLKIALELGLPSVPVQYSEFDLNDDEERKFIINDNLLRRQLSSEERLNLYRVLFPDVDTLLSEEKSNGRPKKGALTIKEIAEQTQQNPESVRKQFQRMREQKRDSVPLLKTSSATKKRDSVPLSESAEHTPVTDSIPDFIKREAFASFAKIEMKFSILNPRDRAEIVKSLKKLLQELEKWQ